MQHTDGNHTCLRSTLINIALTVLVIIMLISGAFGISLLTSSIQAVVRQSSTTASFAEKSYNISVETYELAKMLSESDKDITSKIESMKNDCTIGKTSIDK